LQPIVSGVPKPMAPIIDKPFLELLVAYWKSQGIERVVFMIGYKGQMILAHFGNEFDGMKIEYVEEKKLLGTGGAVKNALSTKQWESDEVLLINGDTWYEVNLQQLVSDSTLSNCPITMTLKELDVNDRYGSVSVDPIRGTVTKMSLLPGHRSLINGGCYLLKIGEVLMEMDSFPDTFSLEIEFLRSMIFKKAVNSSIQNARFLDIGVPVDYKRAAEYIWGKND